MNQVDKDTMKILQDMKDEGKELPDAAKGVVDDSDKEDDTEEKTEEKESDESEETDEDSEEEESEASDTDAEDSEEESEKKTERTPDKRERPVPTWAMVQKANKEAERLQKELTEARKSPSPKGESDATDSELEALAKETNADPAALRRLEAYFEKKFATNGLSEQDRAILQRTQQKLLDTEETEKHQAEVTRVKTFFPELKKDKEAVRRLEKLAYTEKYKGTPLSEVFLENREKILQTKGTQGTRSSESSRGGSQKSSQVRDLEAVVKEGRWGELSDAEFAKLSDKLGVITPNRIFTPVSETKTMRLRRR